MKKLFADKISRILILLSIAAFVLGGCGVINPQDNAYTENIETNDSLKENLPKEGEYYYDVDNVVMYLELYHELPLNYITKEEAERRGWQGGSVEKYIPDAAIGGDYFGNYEGLLPEDDYKECDIDTHNYKNRGSRRLIYTEDGKYYYTKDHYKTFEEVFPENVP